METMKFAPEKDEKINFRILEAMKAYPTLVKNGFCGFENPGKTEPEDRAALLSATDEIERARGWLAAQTRRATFNRRRSSYGLKHVAESATGGYISNGALIVAALMEGWKVERISNSPNARLNIGHSLQPLRKPA